MGVARRANRKFRYSRTELGNHYTGVEANNKRVSYNAYLMDVLKTALRAEFLRLFYRFSYGFKAEELHETMTRYTRSRRGLVVQNFRKNFVKSRTKLEYKQKVGLWLRRHFVGSSFVLDYNYLLKRGLDKHVKLLATLIKKKGFRKLVNFIGKELRHKNQLVDNKVIKRGQVLRLKNQKKLKIKQSERKLS